ncbi:MAG: HD domain-containing protein [Bacillota bacterium]|nr:HD domain-containing protein [Bacillota bacterium]
MRGDKVLRDPVHGLIRVPAEIVPVVDAPELQRLRRIAQLGMSPLTFHGAEHSRFGHALGAMFLFGEVADQLARVGLELSPEARLVGALAALLHDLGHGPLSHALEAESTGGLGHEAWGRRILLGETEIHRRLEALDRGLPERIADVLEGRREPLLHHLISSQMDVDRMDYLIRDSLYTGASAGRFDAGQLIHVLGGVHEAHPVVRNKGLWTVEEYSSPATTCTSRSITTRPPAARSASSRPPSSAPAAPTSKGGSSPRGRCRRSSWAGRASRSTSRWTTPSSGSPSSAGGTPATRSWPT